MGGSDPAVPGPAERQIPRVGRPPVGGRDTRAVIVESARGLFAEYGFERTTTRAVARQAGVDVAMIYHHFASKDDLLTAALAPPAGIDAGLRPVPADTADPGAAVASAVLRLWENDAVVREQALAMFRTASSHEHAAQRVRDAHTTAVLRLVAEVVADDDGEFRAALIGAQLIGVLISRYLLQTDPLAKPDTVRLIAALAPVINHYLTGVLTEPGDD